MAVDKYGSAAAADDARRSAVYTCPDGILNMSSKSRAAMPRHTLYAYPWDVAETGADAFVGEVRALGLDTVAVAGAYHAGKFLRPHGKAGKVYFPQDGTVYFTPDPSRYGAIRPVPNSMLPDADMVRALAGRDDIATRVWLVLLHNTPLGMAHPEATVENAFGDRYPYSLCPAHPDVREYAVALCRDVTESHPVSGLSLETPGFLPYVHGYHHEFALMRSNVWLDNLLGLCFSDHSIAGAEAAGVDARRLRDRVRRDVSAYLDADFDMPDDMAAAFWLADIEGDEDLRGYLKYRRDTVTALVAEIRAAVRPDAEIAVIPSVARPTAGAWYEGTDLAALSAAGITIEACFYEPGPERIAADLFDIRRRIGPDAPLAGIVRPAHPDLSGPEAVVAALDVLRAGGVEDIGFYNYGHLRRASLEWIARALAADI